MHLDLAVCVGLLMLVGQERFIGEQFRSSKSKLYLSGLPRATLSALSLIRFSICKIVHQMIEDAGLSGLIDLQVKFQHFCTNTMLQKS